MAGPQCCSNPPTLNPSSGAGFVTELGGLKAYVTGPSPFNPAILLVSDVYGYEAPNLRKLADKVAAAGFYAVVPDFFYGDPYNPKDPERPLPVWMEPYRPEKAAEDAKLVLAALRSKGVSAIGAAGFCWGGKVVFELAKASYIQAAVLLHPTFVAAEDLKEVKTPTAVLGAELDEITPTEMIKEFEEVLSAMSEIDSFVKIFPGVAHGWTVRYKAGDERTVKVAEEAHRDMLDWFVKHLKSSDKDQKFPARL
ncbi:hypothetical protein Tsubulata_040027 [Turnera subulata]|uniref:Dienelactone hydrolase domain-containing protein n=1 Tax=Turnera subulata TaxID=218843 RepID=A0A9Q0F977_9ROSI|nr:hypothetical protein Tsubulata_040027 [Turnera subulata]